MRAPAKAKASNKRGKAGSKSLALKKWQDQVDAVKAFLSDLESTPTMHGEVWREKMLNHYRKRLEYLKDNRPR